MLKNEYLVAEIGVDTAENEPSKVSRNGGSQNASVMDHVGTASCLSKGVSFRLDGLGTRRFLGDNEDL